MVRFITSEADFEAVVSSERAIVDFTASWCGPCQQIAPTFEKLSSEHPDIVCVKVDVDALEDVAEQCSIDAMPTFLAFSNSKIISRVQGASTTALVNLFKTAFPPHPPPAAAQ